MKWYHLKGFYTTMEVVPDRIRQDFPKGLCFRESNMTENLMGVWATTVISKGATFGPFQGEKKKLQDVEDDTYSWEIRGPKGRRIFCIDAADPSKGNWMRYVKSAHYYEEQNIIATQEKKNIYYKAMRDIPAGEELLCWFSTGYIPKVSPRKGDSSCQDESTDDLSIQDLTKDSSSSGQDISYDDETSGRDTPIQDTPIQATPIQDTPFQDTSTKGALIEDKLHHDTPLQDTPLQDMSTQEASIEDTLHHETPLQDTWNTPTEEAEMMPFEKGPLAIALGGFQISNVVSLASPDSVIVDDSSDLMECHNNMPILEKIQAEVSSGTDVTAPISVHVSPRSKDTTPCSSPPLISPIYDNILEGASVLYNRRANNTSVDHTENEIVTEIGNGIPDSVVSEVSFGFIQSEKDNMLDARKLESNVGDEKNDSEVPQLSVEPSVAPPTMKTTQELSTNVRTTGCMLHDPRDLKKKIDYIATTKGKKNVLKCLTCSNIYPTIDDLKKHFVNHIKLPKRRRSMRRKGRKMILSSNTSLKRSDSNNGQSRPTDNGQESLRETAPLNNAHPATNVKMQCDFCIRSLGNPVLLDEHVKAHLANLIPYQCKICHVEFASLPGIHDHIVSCHSRPEPQPNPSLGTDGTDVSVATYHDNTTHPTSFKKKRRLKRKFPTKSVLQQPQTARDIVMSSPNTSQEIRIKQIRNPKKIYPCSMCDKMFASQTNVYRHKRVVHKVVAFGMRRRRSNSSVRQVRVDSSETSDEPRALSKVKVSSRVSKVKVASRAVTSSSDVPSTEDTALEKWSCRSSPPTSPNTNLHSVKVYMIGGKRVRPILPAPTLSSGVDYSVNTTRNHPASPTANTHDDQRPLASQPHSAPDNVIAAQHKIRHSDMSSVKQPILSLHKFPSFELPNNVPLGVRPSIDVKGQPDLEVTRQGNTSMYQIQSGRFQGNKSRQFAVISPQYANAADRVNQMVPSAHSPPNNASPQQSLNAIYPTSVKHKRKKQSVSPTQFSNPVNVLGNSAMKPQPYVPIGNDVKRRTQHREGIYDQHGAMNLATKKEDVETVDNDTALDLTVHKRGVKFPQAMPKSNIELYQIPVQTNPLDLSMKSTPTTLPTDSVNEKTIPKPSHLSTQLLRALEVVNAHAAMQVKTRNVDLEKLNNSHSHGSSETLIPRQSKTAVTYEGNGFCDESNPQASYAPTLPSYDGTACPPNESQHLLLMTQPAMEKQDVKDVGFVRLGEAPTQEDSVKTTMTVPSKPKTMRFDCNVCNVTFTSMKFMTAHVVEHADEWPYKCEFCVFLFKDPKDLWRHRSDLHRVQKMYACTLCQRDFVYFDNLKKHQIDIHGVKQCVYKELEQGQLRPQNFTDPEKGVSFQVPDSTPEEQHSRTSFLAQEMNKPNTLKIGRLTIKGTSPSVSPAKPNKSTRKQVPFNPQRHHPFARARQIGYLSMLADPKNHQTLSSTLVNRCTKCEKEFDVMADFHQHILECAVQGAPTTQTGAQEAEKSLVPIADIRNTSTPNEPVVDNVTGGKSKQKTTQQTGVSRLATSTPKRQRAKPGLKIYNPMKYSRREPAANMDDIHTCHGCGKKFYFINSLERHMRMCPNREKLKLNDVTQVKQTTKKTDKTLLNSQHQCPFCKHHYTYLKSLKKHVLVCQFRPADIVDPLKIIEENYQRQQEEILRNKQSEEVVDVSNTKQRVTNASKIDGNLHEIVQEKQPKDAMKIKKKKNKKKKKKKKSKVKVHGKTTELPKTLADSTNQDQILSPGHQDSSSSTVSSFSLKLKRITGPGGIPVGSDESEAGGLTNREDTRWYLSPNKGKQSNDAAQHLDDPMNDGKLKKYPIRERNASTSSRYEDLSQLGTRYLRGRGSRARGRARGKSFSSSRGASFSTARGRGSVRRGSGRGRVRKRGGRGVRGKIASSHPGHVSDDVSGAEAPISTTVSEEPRKTERAHMRGRGRPRCRGGSRRARGMRRGGAVSTVSTTLPNNHDVASFPGRDASAETTSLPQVGFDSREDTRIEKNQATLEKGSEVICGKKSPVNMEMNTVNDNNEDHATDSYKGIREEHELPVPSSSPQLADGREHLATPMLSKPDTMDCTSSMDTMPLADSDRVVPGCMEH
ncbi:PR domain zinc finger protein 2-like isoform X1 [Asterias rubens]|uniref:PR domain zinc finger protein 2-like isoform X1 n=2 Tax=Asterias rubens TaxID=7604 RepID=UPI0014550BE8|nr:PR domain zinc finger protein 2-like isoform X1 [Asterias rubens]